MWRSRCETTWRPSPPPCCTRTKSRAPSRPSSSSHCPATPPSAISAPRSGSRRWLPKCGRNRRLGLDTDPGVKTRLTGVSSNSSQDYFCPRLSRITHLLNTTPPRSGRLARSMMTRSAPASRPSCWRRVSRAQTCSPWVWAVCLQGRAPPSGWSTSQSSQCRLTTAWDSACLPCSTHAISLGVRMQPKRRISICMPFGGCFYPKRLAMPWDTFLAQGAPVGIEPLTLAMWIPCSTSWAFSLRALHPTHATSKCFHLKWPWNLQHSFLLWFVYCAIESEIK